MFRCRQPLCHAAGPPDSSDLPPADDVFDPVSEILVVAFRGFTLCGECFLQVVAASVNRLDSSAHNPGPDLVGMVDDIPQIDGFCSGFPVPALRGLDLSQFVDLVSEQFFLNFFTAAQRICPQDDVVELAVVSREVVLRQQPNGAFRDIGIFKLGAVPVFVRRRVRSAR